MNMGYFLGLGGVWLFADALFSLGCYLGKPGQSIWKDHIIRYIRGVIAIALMAIGYWIR